MPKKSRALRQFATKRVGVFGISELKHRDRRRYRDPNWWLRFYEVEDRNGEDLLRRSRITLHTVVMGLAEADFGNSAIGRDAITNLNRSLSNLAQNFKGKAPFDLLVSVNGFNCLHDLFHSGKGDPFLLDKLRILLHRLRKYSTSESYANLLSQCASAYVGGVSVLSRAIKTENLDVARELWGHIRRFCSDDQKRAVLSCVETTISGKIPLVGSALATSRLLIGGLVEFVYFCLKDFYKKDGLADAIFKAQVLASGSLGDGFKELIPHEVIKKLCRGGVDKSRSLVMDGLR